MGQQMSMTGSFLDPAHENAYDYVSDTDHGSSGAPVFDFDWRIVAVHFGDDPEGGKYTMGFRIEYILCEIKRQLAGRPDATTILEKLGLL
ncbi:MAG: hypothetical protein C0483_10355 [Pirellula sp.]|nr:hypothetical protein [Pirellula sp.]